MAKLATTANVARDPPRSPARDLRRNTNRYQLQTQVHDEAHGAKEVGLNRAGGGKERIRKEGNNARRLLKIGRVVMKFATEKGHGAVIYEVSRCQKCNSYPIPITSKF